jgi:hypothetical protein
MIVVLNANGAAKNQPFPSTVVLGSLGDLPNAKFCSCDDSKF